MLSTRHCKLMVNPFLGRKEETGPGVIFTHRRLFSSHRSRDTIPSLNYELSLKGVVNDEFMYG